MCCSVLLCVAECCSGLQLVAVICQLRRVGVCVAKCRCVLQCVAVGCSNVSAPPCQCVRVSVCFCGCVCVCVFVCVCVCIVYVCGYMCMRQTHLTKCCTSNTNASVISKPPHTNLLPLVLLRDRVTINQQKTQGTVFSLVGLKRTTKRKHSRNGLVFPSGLIKKNNVE